MKNETEKVPLPNLIAGCGAEKIIRKIALSSFREKLLLKNDYLLGMEQYQHSLVKRLIFFSPEEEMADIIEGLEKLFPQKDIYEASKEKQEEREADDVSGSENLKEASKEKQEEREADDISDSEYLKKEFIRKPEDIEIFLCNTRQPNRKEGGKSSQVFLEIVWGCYQIPFEVEIFPYKEHDIYPQEKTLEEIFPGKEKVTYCKFPSEEYLSRGFYEILNSLELLNDLSWYKEIYDILKRESVDGRKVWDSFRRLLLKHPMPSVEKRLDTLKSYEDYWYMKKKWENQNRQKEEEYPQWNQVIQLFIQFFAPVFEGVMKDEIFIGDWMPQLGRYLD